MLGAIEIPFDRGLLGHSDGDAVAHALCDAQLGAVGLGDIGAQFPDSDPEWKGAAGADLLTRTRALLADRGARLVQADVTIVAEVPKLAPHRDSMIDRLMELTGADTIGVKARTNEGLGPIGREEAIAVYAVVLIDVAGSGPGPGRE